MRLTLIKKGLLLIAIPLIFQFVFIFILNRALTDAAEAERLVIHTKDVLTTSKSALIDMVRAQSAGRGYVLTANPMFDKEASAEIGTAMSELKKVATKVTDNPEQTVRIQRVLEDAQQLADWILETTSIVRAGRQQDAAQRIVDLEGHKRMNQLRADIDEFLRQETLLEERRLQELRTARDSQRWIVGGGVFGGTLVAAFVAWLFSSGIARRVNVLTGNAEALAENRPLAARLRGEDEIARLDEVMHATSRRLAEASAAERNLTAEVESRAVALAEANESLRQQTQENEMFVYSVSHDLRSPLVNLQGFSQELVHAGVDLRRLLADDRIPPDVRQRVEQVLDSDVSDSIRFIQSAVTRSASIIDALLRLSRAGRVEYRLQEVDVQGTVARVVDAMSNTIEQKAATLTIATLPPCWGDSTAVEQIFGNLIGNAVNYLDPARPGTIEVGISDDSRAARDGCNTYYVRDNGLGIPSAYLEKVFVAFQRLHGEVARGEGIGLALVKRAVERHGGEIWVESIEGIGTTFYLALKKVISGQ